MLRNLTHLPNLWELICDGQRAVTPLENWGGGPADAAKTGLFDYRAFSPSKATDYRDTRLPTQRAQAEERPVYTAIAASRAGSASGVRATGRASSRDGMVFRVPRPWRNAS